MDPADWLNSSPLTLDALHGKVVLVDFWAFECWNCYRSFPWLKAMEARLEPSGLQIIGAHAPEFDREKVRSNVEAKVHEFGLMHPVMIDNDYSYWHAMGNRFWPAYYIIDKQGRVRAIFVGETHEGEAQAVEIETFIRKLLAEPA
jgi:thiol-disulfide isomerase/thioredoxin